MLTSTSYNTDPTPHYEPIIPRHRSSSCGPTTRRRKCYEQTNQCGDAELGHYQETEGIKYLSHTGCNQRPDPFYTPNGISTQTISQLHCSPDLRAHSRRTAPTERKAINSFSPGLLRTLSTRTAPIYQTLSLHDPGTTWRRKELIRKPGVTMHSSFRRCYRTPLNVSPRATAKKADKEVELEGEEDEEEFFIGTLRRNNTICYGDAHNFHHKRSSSSEQRNSACKRHSKSTFDSGFESVDILDQILNSSATNTTYDTIPEKTKWQSFKKNVAGMFGKKSKDTEPDRLGNRVQRYLKLHLARISRQDLDMGGFEEKHWRTLEPRHYHRTSKRTESFVKWDSP